MRRIPIVRVVLAAAAAPALLGAGAIAFAATARTDVTRTLAVTAGKPSELRFTLARRTIGRGTITFRVTNRGGLRHNFRIGGRSTLLIRPGATRSVTVTLPPGKYGYRCTVDDHSVDGMRGTLTVI